MPKSSPHPLLRKLGRRIKELRSEKNWSQEELAAKCGLDRSYMSGIERGVRNITLLRVLDIAEALGTSIQRLLDFS